MKTVPYISVAIVALLAVSCSKKEKATVQPPVRVETMIVAPTEITGSRAYSGTVEESSTTTISFAAPGTIQSINVAAGDRVTKGQLIGTLDAASLQHTYDIARATLNEAQDAYNRMKQLHDSNSLSDMKWVEIENTLSQAKSAEAIAKKGLEDARLYAPISGYVSEKFADVGMVAAPGVPVVKIVAIDPVKVSVPVPENEIAEMLEGRVAQITVSALGGEKFTGKINEKGVAANPISRAYDVKINVANPQRALLPGMICDVVFENSDTTVNAIVLPTAAVLLDSNNSNFVWLKKDGKAEKRIVKVGMMTDAGLTISDGLVQGDSVIVAGQQKVSSGNAVVDVK